MNALFSRLETVIWVLADLSHNEMFCIITQIFVIVILLLSKLVCVPVPICQCNRNWYMQKIVEFTLQLKCISDNLFLTAAVAAFPLL